MLAKNPTESGETGERSSTRQVKQQQDMLQESSQRPSAIRKYNNLNINTLLMGTKDVKNEIGHKN